METPQAMRSTSCVNWRHEIGTERSPDVIRNAASSGRSRRHSWNCLNMDSKPPTYLIRLIAPNLHTCEHCLQPAQSDGSIFIW